MKKIPSQPQGHAYSQIKLFLSILHGQISSRREKEKKNPERDFAFQMRKKYYCKKPNWTPPLDTQVLCHWALSRISAPEQPLVGMTKLPGWGVVSIKQEDFQEYKMPFPGLGIDNQDIY